MHHVSELQSQLLRRDSPDDDQDEQRDVDACESLIFGAVAVHSRIRYDAHRASHAWSKQRIVHRRRRVFRQHPSRRRN